MRNEPTLNEKNPNQNCTTYQTFKPSRFRGVLTEKLIVKFLTNKTITRLLIILRTMRFMWCVLTFSLQVV